jgi:hypothetical protein
VRWDSYLPYEARFIGAFVRLGWKGRAYEVLKFLMKDRRPTAWNAWGEIVSKDPLAPRTVGDLPHSWAASDFIRSVRSMFAYERDDDSALVVGAGIPDEWVEDPHGVEIRNLPTEYGTLSFTLRRDGGEVVYTLSGDVPPGGLLVCPPLTGKAIAVHGDNAGQGPRGEVLVRRLPARIGFVYH